MRYNELITEAQLTPGQVKAIKVKIGQYEEELRKLNLQQNKLDDMYRYRDYPQDSDLQAKLDNYVKAYTDAIQKLRDELKGKEDNKAFYNLMAGIQKNCSEIIEFYKKSKSFLYAGFKNAGDHSALFAKSPEHIVVPKFYDERNFSEVSYMIEQFYDFGNFNNAILANGYYSNVTQDGRKSFLIFPANGFKFFYSKRRTNLTMRDREIPRLFDKDLLLEGWQKFVADDAMYEKFIAAGAKIESRGKDVIAWYGGFMGEDNYENHLAAIDTLAENGELDVDWDRMGNWVSWVSKNSFDKEFMMSDQNLVNAIGLEVDMVVNTPTVYAIDANNKKQVAEVLGIGLY